MKARPPYSTIGVAKFNPENPYHIRVKQKRDEYRAAMQAGIRISHFKELFFACSKCGNTLPLQSTPVHLHCGECGQWFQFKNNQVKECGLPEELNVDPAQITLEMVLPP